MQRLTGSLGSRAIAAAAFWMALATARCACGQSFGIELHNTLMPASGGMAGTSIARPQDFLSAINGNPAALSLYSGTQFLFGGAFAEPTFDLTQTGNVVPNVTPFSAKSATPGVAAPNLGVSQDFNSFGLPVKAGLGLISNAGGGVDFRGVPASNGTSSDILILQITSAAAVDLTDRLSVGGSLSVGNAFFDGPFVGAGAMAPAYALRGSVGVNYWVTPRTTLGGYYQSVERFKFNDAIRLELPGNQFDVARDVRLGLPDNVGLGLANNTLFDGRLLLAADVLYKQWDNAPLFDAIYRNQWVLQVGSQYSANRYRLRLGYAYAENPLVSNVGLSPGGVTPPGGIPAIDYLQAQLAIINRHRFAAGIGFVDVLPGVDLDFFAGGMFPASAQLGDLTRVEVSSYFLGAGLAWRFGRGSACAACCRNSSAANDHATAKRLPAVWER